MHPIAKNKYCDYSMLKYDRSRNLNFSVMFLASVFSSRFKILSNSFDKLVVIAYFDA